MELVHSVFRAMLYMAALGLLSHIIGQALPRHWFHGDRGWFRQAAWEENGRFYERLKIRRWKTRLPDKSRVVKSMVPKRLDGDTNSAKLDLLVKETCVAEVIHLALALVSPTIYRFCRNAVGVVFSVLFGIGNLPFVAIQRYNRPKLLALQERMRKREESQDHARADSVG